MSLSKQCQADERLQMKAYEALLHLGETGDTVARRLRTARCHGERHTSRSCPVAQYMKKKSFSSRAPRVKGTEFVFKCGTRYLMVPLPSAVRNFIRMFDDGHHPSLELKK